MARHELMGGHVNLYKRPDSEFWQCAAFLNGRNYRKSTKETSLAAAKDMAEDWYLTLIGRNRRDELKGGKTFKYAAERFVKEYEALVAGERNPKYVESHSERLRVHLLPFFQGRFLTEITPGLVQDYRIHRMTSRFDKKTGEVRRPSRSTLQHEMVTLRLVLKAAHRHGWIPYLPDFSAPYKASGKIGHRAWFSPAEYKKLYEASRERARNPKNLRWKEESERFHDYVLFMVNTGLRPDEASRLQFQDVAIVSDAATGERILEIEVRGKRGVGFCKSMPGAVHPFGRLLERAKARKKAEPESVIFGKVQRELLNNVLDELKLKKDRDGKIRTAYSLRHTYICLRLMEGADIYQVAKNCRTSVEMIEKFYARHIKDMIDASAINVRKPRVHNTPPKNQKSLAA